MVVFWADHCRCLRVKCILNYCNWKLIFGSIVLKAFAYPLFSAPGPLGAASCAQMPAFGEPFQTKQTDKHPITPRTGLYG